MKINGPIELVFGLAVLLGILAFLLLKGKCSWLIAGYNTASRKEKEQYDENKLCRVMGISVAILAVIMLVIAVFSSRLPDYFDRVFGGCIVVDVVVTLILLNTICKKK